jgi:hypothetical protein
MEKKERSVKMKKNANRSFVSNLSALCTFALIITLGGAGTLSYGADGPLANVQSSSSQIFFDPVLANENLSLTVGGEGGFYAQRDFNAGETPSFQTGSLPDGNYKYELRTIPETDLEALAEAEQNGDEQRIAEITRAEQEQMIVQSGGFQIVDGVIVQNDVDQKIGN